MSTRNDGTSEEQPRVVIRDRRRIDPETGAPRQVATVEVGRESDAGVATPVAPASGPSGTAGGAGAPGDGEAADPAALTAQLAERTADLQRVTAEYANYRKRVDRDRQRVTDQATGAVLTSLLPVLDDIDRARTHGDLTGAFAAVAEQLVGTLTKFGLTAFGEPGDPFDPTVHEAVAHTTSAEVAETACVEVLRKGYSLGDRLLRAAMVVVADPAPGPAGPAEERPDDGASEAADASGVAGDPSPDGVAASDPSGRPAQPAEGTGGAANDD